MGGVRRIVVGEDGAVRHVEERGEDPRVVAEEVCVPGDTGVDRRHPVRREGLPGAVGVDADADVHAIADQGVGTADPGIGRSAAGCRAARGGGPRAGRRRRPRGWRGGCERHWRGGRERHSGGCWEGRRRGGDCHRRRRLGQKRWGVGDRRRHRRRSDGGETAGNAASESASGRRQTEHVERSPGGEGTH